MAERFIWGVALGDAVLALSTVAAAALAAVIVHLLLSKVAKGPADKTRTGLDDALVSAVEKPLIGAILITGLYLASFFLPLLPAVRSYANRGFSIAMSLVAIFGALAVVDGLLHWFQYEVASKTQTTLDSRLAKFLRVVAPVSAVSVAVVVVLNMVGIPLTPVTRWLIAHGARLALIMAMLVAAIFALDQALPKLVGRTMTPAIGESDAEVQKRTDTLTRVLVTGGRVVAVTIAGFMLLSELGINIGPVLAGLGVAGLAFGFGGQYLIRDLIAGTFIIIENQYRVGDVARVADIAGLVEDINLRRTVLRDLDGIVHVVPNGEIKVASNFTRGYSRVNLNISVAYGTDLDHAIVVINRVGKELAEDPQWAPLLISTPQVLRVDSLGDSGIELKILGDTKPIQQWAVMGELRKRIKKAFDEEGIEIPWPHTKVYFGNQPPSGG